MEIGGQTEKILFTVLIPLWCSDTTWVTGNKDFIYKSDNGGTDK